MSNFSVKKNKNHGMSIKGGGINKKARPGKDRRNKDRSGGGGGGKGRSRRK